MSETTPRLRLPLLQAGQAQKEQLTHNEALSRLDACVQGVLIALRVDVPPAAPLPGQCWLIGAAPQAAWAGAAGQIALWTDGGWRFVAPMEGMRFWIGVGTGYAIFAGGEWRIGEAHGRVLVNGEQVVGARQPAIAEPTGGTMVDAAARQVLSAILASLRGHGLIEGG